MIETVLLFILYYAAAGIVSYAAPRLLVALGVPLDEWIVTVAAAASIHMTRDAAKWSITLALGMALFGTATFFSARSIPLQRNITEVTTSPYRVQTTDDVLDVVTLPATIILPIGFPKGKSVTVKDKKGEANIHPILVTAENGKIDGLTAFTISSNRGSMSFIWDGTGWSFY